MLTYILAPLALLGAWDICKRIKQKLFVWKISRDARKYRPYPYDGTSPMVQRFQYLAGIRGDLYTTYSRNSLRERFNRVRSTCYST